MKICEDNVNLILEDVNDFDIEDILECGQCFNFNKLDENDYELIAYGKYLHIKQENSDVTMYNTSLADYENVWKNYFDMDRDYGEIKTRLISADERLCDAIEEKSGIRILNQEFFEMLISFIISQNKQIPHIKQIVRTISDRYGREIDAGDGRIVHAFPTLSEMLRVTEDDLRECKTGFRAPYIRDAVEKCANGLISENDIKVLSVEEARNKLMEIKGVGEKVANCVMLFSLGFRKSFPVDVWMKRIMEFMYFDGDTKKDVIEAFAYDRFGDYAGYAQQYLFCYGRSNGIGK